MRTREEELEEQLEQAESDAAELLAACEGLLESSRKIRGEVVVAGKVQDSTLGEMFAADDAAQAAIANAKEGANG